MEGGSWKALVTLCQDVGSLWASGYLAAVRDSLPSLSLYPHPPTPVHHAGPCCHGNWRSESRSDRRRDSDSLWNVVWHQTRQTLSLFFSRSVHLSLSVWGLRWRSWRCMLSALKRRCFLLSLCCCERSNSQGALHLSDSQFALRFFWWAHKCVLAWVESHQRVYEKNRSYHNTGCCTKESTA